MPLRPMTRFTMAVVLFAGCSVGEVPLNGGGTDGGGGSADGGGGTQLQCAPRLGTPATAYNHSAAANVPNPPTAAGAPCGDCHAGQIAGVPLFTSSGTVYKLNKTDPQPGVAVRLYSETGAFKEEVFTDSAGNFRFELANDPPFPVKTQVSACGTPVEMHDMVSPIGRASEGNCNLGNCHGDNQGNGRIYLAD